MVYLTLLAYGCYKLKQKEELEKAKKKEELGKEKGKARTWDPQLVTKV